MKTFEKINYRKLFGLRESLHAYAYSMTSSYEDAEDLVQDTFLKALVHENKFDPTSNLRAWVFTIMKNTFINKYRKELKQKTFVDTTRELFYLNNSSRSETAGPESQYNYNEINKVMRNMKEEQRIPFQMHFEGYKYMEIADALNLSIGTVKSRIFFTRKKMMEYLKHQEN
jgi:RNA polymerase sigma-70 factor (ECF subfamily)